MADFNYVVLLQLLYELPNRKIPTQHTINNHVNYRYYDYDPCGGITIFLRQRRIR